MGPRTRSGELPADSWHAVGLVGAVYHPDRGPHAANGDSVWLEAGTPAAAGQPAPDSELGRGHCTSCGLFPRGEPSWGRERGRTGLSAGAWRGRPWLLPRLTRPGSRAADAPASDPPGDPAARRPAGGGCHTCRPRWAPVVASVPRHHVLCVLSGTQGSCHMVPGPSVESPPGAGLITPAPPGEGPKYARFVWTPRLA